MTRRAIALIDYDNTRPDRFEPERTSSDVQVHLIRIVDHVLDTLSKLPDAYSEVRTRFYGGWVHEDGRWTERADWMRTELRALRGLYRGIRLLPEIAVATVRLPALGLLGTARIRTDKSGYRLQQKMVDTMLAVDLCSIVLAPDEDVIVMSDDDDLVPALLAGQERLKRVTLARYGPSGGRCNDRHLDALGIAIQVLGNP